MPARIKAKYRGVEVELVTCLTEDEARAACALHDGGVIDVEALTGEFGSEADRVWLRENVKRLAARKTKRSA